MQNILINIVLIRKTVWCLLSSLKSLWTVITVLRYVLGTRDNSAVQILTRVTLDRSALTTPNVFWLQCTRPWTTTTSCWKVPCSSPLWSALAKTPPRRPLLTRLLRTLSALFNALSPPLFRALWYVALCKCHWRAVYWHMSPFLVLVWRSNRRRGHPQLERDECHEDHPPVARLFLVRSCFAKQRSQDLEGFGKS